MSVTIEQYRHRFLKEVFAHKNTCCAETMRAGHDFIKERLLASVHILYFCETFIF